MSNTIKKLLDSTSEEGAMKLIMEFAEPNALPDLSYIIVASALLRMYRDRVIRTMEEIHPRKSDHLILPGLTTKKDGGLQ